MISYETYKSLHIFFILSFFSSLGFVSCGSQLLQKKLGKWMVGLASFLIMVAGMGLIARLGFTHGKPFPFWVNLKIGNWILINFFFNPFNPFNPWLSHPLQVIPVHRQETIDYHHELR